MNNKTLLVVDDEEDILELVRFNLDREGYTVLCAETGEAALRSLKEHAVDLLVLDLMLPGMDGLEVTRPDPHRDAYRQGGGGRYRRGARTRGG